MHVAESRNGWPLGPGLILTRAALPTCAPALHDGAVGVTGPPRPVMRQQAGLTDYISRLGNSEAVRLQSTPVSRCNVTPGEPGLNRKHVFREAAPIFRLRTVSYKSLARLRKELNGRFVRILTLVF